MNILNGIAMERKIENIDEFKKNINLAINWIEKYFSNIDNYPVLSQLKAGDIKSKLPQKPTELPEDFKSIMDDFEKLIIPGITHWNHPRFFAYFSITGSMPGIIGELLSSTLNVNAMLWKTSPAATELEEVVLDWLRQMLGLPPEFEGIINDTASVSSLCAIAAARENARLEIREKGMAGRTDLPPICMYTSEESHSSIEKAAITLGIGQNWIRKIQTDENFCMNAENLQTQITRDISSGYKPICVVATIGTTSTTSVDPVKKIVDICQQYNIWLHIDAAYGGVGAFLPELNDYFKGWEQADSIVVNPHKWLFTPIDCSTLYCRKSDILKQAFSLVPEYLKTTESDSVKNYMDYGISLGRRFRALKLWIIIRSLGTTQIKQIIQQHISYAQKLSQMIEKHPDFELLAPVPFSTLVFRFMPQTDRNQLKTDKINKKNSQLLEKINATGKVFLSHTKLRDKYGIRFAIGNLKTTWDDIQLAWEIIQESARQLDNLEQ